MAKLNFIHTIGGNLFYLGDADDENAPMLEIRFQNEFAQIHQDDKDQIAAAMFDTFLREVKKHERGRIVEVKR